jgi:hypothetical protein
VTTSEYLRTQTDLLIAVKDLRCAPLEAFAARARELATGTDLVDARGYPVENDATYLCEVVEAAMEFRDRVERKRPGSAASARGAMRGAA